MDWGGAVSLFGYYFTTVTIETPILMIGLSPVHSWRRRLFTGVWLTACTYPLLSLVLPALIDPVGSRGLYLLVGEVGVAVLECLLFWLAFSRGRRYPARYVRRDCLAIVLANLASFLVGELWHALT